MSKFKEYTKLDLPKVHKEILQSWKSQDILKDLLSYRKNNENFTFYEGPPSANGKPGIHHLIARTIKDLFCRYKTLKGYFVDRKAGWDTHGLPVELAVEDKLGITKEDIGSKISITKYNSECKKNVMQFQGQWEDLTSEMGFWVDMKNPYVTYNNKYIESVWWILSRMHQKKLLYKGFTIQPFSPKAGTGLSTHELNQPGCYKDVKDTSAVAMFEILKNDHSSHLFNSTNLFILAWTTTPWTLPSNTALAVGKNIDYVLIKTYNPYNHKPIEAILAKKLLSKYFSDKIEYDNYNSEEKDLPYIIIKEFKGRHLIGLSYDQLFKYKQPIDGDAFKIIEGDFVTTDDGTGIVHVAPSFGSDDNLVAKKNGIGSLTLVDKQGKFTDDVFDLKGRYVKDEYYVDNDTKPEYSVDIELIIKLKEKERLFKSEKYLHSYPHCWRTDKPILYYPMDSWFVKTTDFKDRMIELNKTINWCPKSTGEGRFGNWLENLVDWNLSRSRYWGIPLPIWRTLDGKQEKCISSIQHLKDEIQRSVKLGFMKDNPLINFISNDFSQKNYDIFDLHRPNVDNIILVSDDGKPMKRELDLIDVWFDSGSMPYAQLHYPFENKEYFNKNFPADFIAEGVDQTRGWFFTLHAISTILFDSVAYKNVISNGLVLDKEGNKMSKRLGNAVDPFDTIKKYGADACRWYMISNAQPWDNLKFDIKGIQEVQRKFFSTLYNAYSFFVMYANIDSFVFSEKYLPIEDRPEIDRWIISELNSLVRKVDDSYFSYDPTKSARLIQSYVLDKLSNWFIRLSRRRFWKGQYNQDKISAYQTLYECLEKISIISSPIAPFFMDNLFKDLNSVTNLHTVDSVHFADFPGYNNKHIDIDLEKRICLAQDITSLALSLRKSKKIRVRQPLNQIIIPVINIEMENEINKISDILLAELNIKSIKYVKEDEGFFKKEVKPNFKVLGPKYGKNIGKYVNLINRLNTEEINILEENKLIKFSNLELAIDDVEIFTGAIPGYEVASYKGITVALDVNITDKLKNEGLSRELVNRIQNLRKENNLVITDRINIYVKKNDVIENFIDENLSYICNETLSDSLEMVDDFDDKFVLVNLVHDLSVRVFIKKI